MLKTTFLPATTERSEQPVGQPANGTAGLSVPIRQTGLRKRDPGSRAQNHRVVTAGKIPTLTQSNCPLGRVPQRHIRTVPEHLPGRRPNAAAAHRSRATLRSPTGRASLLPAAARPAARRLEILRATAELSVGAQGASWGAPGGALAALEAWLGHWEGCGAHRGTKEPQRT